MYANYHDGRRSLVVSRWRASAFFPADTTNRERPSTVDRRRPTMVTPYSNERNQTRRDPCLLSHVVFRLGTPALVAGAIALGDDRWSIFNAEHFMDEC